MTSHIGETAKCQEDDAIQSSPRFHERIGDSWFVPFSPSVRSFQGPEAYGSADAEPEVGRLFHRIRDQKANPTSPLNRYIAGWAEADVDKILAATVSSYRFTDPLVGSFSGRSLHEYFDLLRDRFSHGRAIGGRELAFFLHGPIDRQSNLEELQFWRVAPRIGLTGVTEIEIGERGVITERVAYDLNMASDILCRVLH